MKQTLTLERRFREGSGERYLKSDPNRVRCQACASGKTRALRIKYEDPDLEADQLWPEAQCSKAALEGTFGCKKHAGKSAESVKFGMLDYMPEDLAAKIEVFSQNTYELLNRTNDIALLKARNAELFEQLEELVLGEEAYEMVLEARRLLRRGDVVDAGFMLDAALESTKKETEVWEEVRKNTIIVEKLTVSHFTIAEKLKVMTTIDQMRSLVDGVYRGGEILFKQYIPDPDLRTQAMMQYAKLIRDLTNSRQGLGLESGK